MPNKKQEAEVARKYIERQHAISDGKNEIDLLYEWILGDGDWDTGLMARILLLESKMRLIFFLLGAVTTAVIGVVVKILLQ